MNSSSRFLDIRVISGEGLRLNRRQAVKKNAFVVIQTDSVNAECTKIDTEGGAYPMWNEKIVVNMPQNMRNITVEVQCKTYSGNKIIGTAKIPVTDFVGGYIPANYLHFLSYRLRDKKGERNGIINLSIRVKGNDDANPHYSRVNAAALYAPAYLSQNGGSCGVGSNGWRDYMTPASNVGYSWQSAGAPADEKGSNGVVNGFPIWQTNQV